MEPRAVTKIAMVIGINLFLKVQVIQFCKNTEKSNDAMYEARGTAAIARLVPSPSELEYPETISRYKGKIVAHVFRETRANIYTQPKM